VNEKQILITGATNGIGLAAAEALAAFGANLAIVGRSKTRTRIAAARIRAAGRREATVATFIADLSSQHGLDRDGLADRSTQHLVNARNKSVDIDEAVPKASWSQTDLRSNYC
jgi:short-subunit dehydrogenase